MSNTQPIENVIVRAQAQGAASQVQQWQIYEILGRQQTAANDPVYNRLATKAPIEEVKVVAKKRVAAKTAAFVGSRFVPYLGWALLAYDVYEFAKWGWSQLVNEGIQEHDDNVANDLEKNIETPIGTADYQQYPVEVVTHDGAKQMEEVLVVAKRVDRGFITIIDYPPGFGDNFAPTAVPYPPIVPNIDFQPFAFPQWQAVPQRQWDPFRPSGEPVEDPDTRPVRNPTQWDLLDELPSGSIQIEPTLEGGLRYRAVQKLRPRQREENKLRKDRKSEKASSQIRAVYRLVNKTYGELTELQDLWEVISENVYVDGKKLSSYENITEALAAAAQGADFYVDYEQLAMDYALMEIQDYAIGRMSQFYGHTVSETGWWISRQAFRPIPGGG